MNKQATLEKIVALSKRRGFVFPSSEIYGGMANVYDFGPYGNILKENLRNLWLKNFIYNRDDIYAIDSSVIMNPAVWEASGHTASFADVMVEDKVNHKRHRADHLIEAKLDKLKDNEIAELAAKFVNYDNFEEEKKEGLLNRKVDGLSPGDIAWLILELKLKSPDGNELTEPKPFNQLFQTEVGIISGEKNKAYLRGEIAQGLFMNFKNILDSMHPKLPFGIGQAGKAFRNEITMGKFTFRTLEFDLMEFEYFFDKDKMNWEELFESWKGEMQKFAEMIGLNSENLRWRPHEDFERSHYSSRTEDLEYEFAWGFKEMWGLAYRSDYDLRNHQEKSGKDLTFRYPDGTKVLPHVIEPTFGLSRLVTVLMFDAYTEDTVNDKTRVLMKFDPKIAPVKFALFPLQKDEKLIGFSKEIYSKLRKRWYGEFDNSGNIGKMYRKQDEIGTPFCITVDYDSLEDQSVTIRDRDTMKQERIKIEDLEAYLEKALG
jgi:glycyl-tRNA synthetase